MHHVITDDHDLGGGWTLFTEFKPVDEDAGIWGWYWAIEQNHDGYAEPVEAWSSLSVASRSMGDMGSGLPGKIFGPFSSEEIAKESGISLCAQVKKAPDLLRLPADETNAT